MSAPSRAEDDAPDNLAHIVGNYGIIEQAISVPFKPVSVYALVEAPGKGVKQYHAAVVPTAIGATSVEAGQTVTVGALIPFPTGVSADGLFHFTFFLASLGGDFAATEVRSWTWKTLKGNSLALTALESEIDRLEDQIQPSREENMQLEARLTQLKESASKIAGVDALIDLQSELDSLKGFDEKKASEVERLRSLAYEAELEPDPPGMDDMLMNLNDQLRRAARITADADRLGTSRKESVEANFQRKLDLVRDTENANAQELAQEALRLRKQRQELEARLNEGQDTAAPNSEF